MVKLWYMKNIINPQDDQRSQLHLDPPQYVDLKDLEALTGVLYTSLNPDTWKTDGSLDKIKKERGYTYEDCVEISRETLPDYENKIKSFFQEHLHTDEEIRLIEKGSGYFDVRTAIEDKWIRIECIPGDLIVLPAGIYHRFTLDSNNYVKARRYFIGEPVWEAHNRPEADESFPNIREAYLKSIELKCN